MFFNLSAVMISFISSNYHLTSYTFACRISKKAFNALQSLVPFSRPEYEFHRASLHCLPVDISFGIPTHKLLNRFLEEIGAI